MIVMVAELDVHKRSLYPAHPQAVDVCFNAFCTEQ